MVLGLDACALSIAVFKHCQYFFQTYRRGFAAALHRRAQLVVDQPFKGQGGFHRSGVGLDEQAVNQWQQLEEGRPAVRQPVVAKLLIQPH